MLDPTGPDPPSADATHELPEVLDDSQPSLVATSNGLGISRAADTFLKMRRRMGEAQEKLAVRIPRARCFCFILMVEMIYDSKRFLTRRRFFDCCDETLTMCVRAHVTVAHLVSTCL